MADILVANGVVRAVGWALVQSLWQGTLVAGLAALALLALRRRTASVRYLIACAALALMAAAPVVTAIRAARHLPVASAAGVTTRAHVAGGLDAGTPGAEAGFPAAGPDSSSVVVPAGAGGVPTSWWGPAYGERALPAVVLAWLAGVFVLSLRLLAGWLAVGRLRRRATRPVDAWQARVAALAGSLRMSRPVRLFESSLVEGPVVIGWLRPVILLPASALAGLSPAQLEAVIAHELAHVRRHDYLVNLIQTTIETLLFYHPAGWWLSRRIRIEREHCCDDVAIGVCGDRVTYARALADLEALRRVVAPLALAATGGALENRVRRILGLPRHQDRGARAWGAAWLGLAVLSLSAAGTSVTRAAAPQAASRPDGPAASRLDAADSSQDLMLKGDVVIRSDDRVIRTDFATLRLVPAEPGGQQAQAGATGQADTEEQTRQAQEEIQMALQGLSRQTEEIRRQIDEARRSLEEARRQLEQARVGQVEAIGRQLEASRAAADPGEPDIRPLFDLEALRRQIEQLGVAPGGRLGGVRSPLPVGLLQNGRYHHNRTGIEFDVPAEWSFLSDGPSSDGGDMARVRDSASDVILSAWMNRDDTPSRPAADRLRYVVGMKIRQRYDQGYRDYWVSPETIVEKMVGGRPALSAVGTYVSNGQTMAEYLIWVDGEATQAFFFTSVAASDLAALQSRFDQIVESAVVP